MLTKSCEESRTELQTDREDKEDQPEVFHEGERLMVHRLPEIPEGDSGEEDAGGAETYAAELDAAKRHPKYTDE